MAIVGYDENAWLVKNRLVDLERYRTFHGMRSGTFLFQIFRIKSQKMLLNFDGRT